MEDRAEVKSWQPSIRLFGGFFLFMLLLSLDNFHSAEVAARDYGWRLEFAIAAPWVCGLLVGAILYLAPRRKHMSEQTASVLLILLASVISSSYEAMDRLSRLIH